MVLGKFVGGVENLTIMGPFIAFELTIGALHWLMKNLDSLGVTQSGIIMQLQHLAFVGCLVVICNWPWPSCG